MDSVAVTVIVMRWEESLFLGLVSFLTFSGEVFKSPLKNFQRKGEDLI